MQGLRVKCPNCKRVLFETTDKYNPDITPNGSMVKFLKGYALDWLTISTTGVSEMTCPECLAQLAPAGRLLVVEPEPEKVLGGGEPADLTSPFTSDGNQKLEETAGMGDQVDATVTHAPKSYPCPICGKPFASERALSGHKASHKKKG